MIRNVVIDYEEVVCMKHRDLIPSELDENKYSLECLDEIFDEMFV